MKKAKEAEKTRKLPEKKDSEKQTVLKNMASIKLSGSQPSGSASGSDKQTQESMDVTSQSTAVSKSGSTQETKEGKNGG